ncbi:S8 family serine peptidase [Sutterella seckii]|uniref:S8 family serine peptidase n=1 Tax=Sutterella seckii TaxID=1944635 RepID=A0A6I1EUU2_9BURK|nr:autotransporter domain-containing protein [Sutterella seckii]KAB7652991.1 S8 family serine peptidase [Sutterella seckii]
MNRVFKTKWSVAHQEYVVTDEKHASKTKAAKSVVALAVAALMLGAGAASAAYMAPKAGSQDPGFVANSSNQLDAAKKSWETAEYKKDWGLTAMKASSAYALGYHGQGVAVGVMDSGALLQKHSELAGDRFHASHNQGQYGSTGNRYPQGAGSQFDGKYEAGQDYDVTGDWVLNMNDSHGTHVTGTVGANRDGSEFHGVAWGSDIHVGNTGGTDDSNYGPFLDYQFFLNGWGQLAQDIVAQNGEKRGGVINNSFGTNTRVNATSSSKQGADGFNIGTMMEVNTTGQTEYEYFLFKKIYGENPSFVDAAYDAVKGTNVVQVMTTGNRDMKNPYYRALYPYFNPEAEKHWIAVAGLKKLSGEGETAKYDLVKNFNEAGNAKWWTVVGPGNAIYSSAVVDGSYLVPGQNNGGNPVPEGVELGSSYYATWGGTSMAAPHVSGAMGVLMSRYDQMSAIQVRDVMFTTATHKNPDGTDFDSWTAAPGEVDERMGWGLPDLEAGMYGPGQLLGSFDYDMSAGSLDVWSNKITQIALDQREREDLAWKAAAEKWMKNPTLAMTGLSEDEKALLGEMLTDTNEDLVGIDDALEKMTEEEAIAWRKEYFQKRLDTIQAKIDGKLYDGSLIKRGEGTLIMTGSNTYRGGTTVEGGKLLGYSNSFGVSGDDGKANGKVVVNGGTFGILETYNDQFTMKGEIERGEGTHSVDVVVNEGGTFQITAGQDVTMGTLEFKEGAGFTVGSEDVDVLKEAYAGKEQTGTVTTTGVTGDDLAVANPDYAFFKTELKVDGNKLTGTLSRDETKSFATYAQNANGQAIAGALEGAAGGALYDALIGASKGDVAKTYNSLGDDFILNTRNAGIVNGMTLSRAIKDQATGIGEGRKVEMADGTARLWATGVGSWSALDYGQSDMDSDFYAGLFGAEVDVCSATKLGLFFGAGSTDNKAGDNKVESDDIHFGAYGVTNFSDVVNATYGFVYSHQSADATRALQVGSQLGMNAFSGDTDITQIFAEAAYTGLNTDAYSIEPYFGLSWIHAESDGFNEQVGTMAFSTTTEDQDVQVTTLGVRGAIPFTMGETKVALKGDVAWNHFFGDTEAEASMALAGSGVARLKGGELGDMASVGLGVEAQVGKMTTMGLSYTGAYDGDITSHGISANVRFNF